MTQTSLSSTRLRSSRFAFTQPHLFFARATLYTDAIELTGWRGLEIYRRQIRLDRILQVDVVEADCLVLWLIDGEVMRIRIRDALNWKDEIDIHRDGFRESK